MQTSAEPIYSASSPPFIFDSDMSGRPDSDTDLEFFNSRDLESASSPSFILAEDFATDSSHFLGAFGSPEAGKSAVLDQATPSNLLDTNLHRTLSAPSTASPSGSYQDSCSETSGYKRKSSSESSRSAFTNGDTMMADEMDMPDWKANDYMRASNGSNFGGFDGTINPSAMDTNYEFSDKTMENDFDFESAASSPSAFGNRPAEIESPELPTINYGASQKNNPIKTKFRNHHKANSQYSVTQSMNGLKTGGSREASPLAAMITSHESSPSAFFNHSPSPGTGVDFINGSMLNNVPPNNAWPPNYEYFPNGLPVVPHGLPNSSTQKISQPHPQLHAYPIPLKPTLTIHPTPLKSRVETQIPIKLTLFPVPMGVSRLHLPPHTISKPKLLAKPAPELSSDTLELSTTLVCTSAMQNPEHRQRAFERAAAGEFAKEESPSENSDEDDEGKPLNGGDVKICVGCITRERKRAARKKVKKVEEEESWHKDEAKRVVVFNTHEVKDWVAPTSQPPSEATGDRAEPFIPDGAMQVDIPMRIACYCRHQNEKLGFQVIFTIKDSQGQVIAQAITNSIMITDDHKTHNMPNISTQHSNGSDIPVPAFPGTGAFSTEAAFDMPATVNTTPFRHSHSSSDLQSLHQTFNLQYQQPISLATSSQATATPRNISRQVSPSASNGPLSKKRKASGSTKVPTGLAMTRLETGDINFGQPAPSAPASALAPTSVSPFTPSHSSFPIPQEHQYGQIAMIPNISQQYNTGPPTPNSNDQFFSPTNRSHSMENLTMNPLYSAPPSAHPSRAPSPNGIRTNVQAIHQAQVAQAVANGLYGIPLSLNPHRPPTIHKLIPNEGPKAGGIEVTCLGSGFCQGLEVMFGDCKATTTTFWGETSLVCLLPPSVFAGTVPVTFKHHHQQQSMSYPSPPVPKQHAIFKYIDDDEQQIIRTALSVLGHKMTGKMEDVRELARRIVGDGSSSWGAPAKLSQGGSAGNQNVSGFSAATFGVNVEATLLKCLDLIDLDDSPNPPRLNLRRASGQTMLHLACSLGLHRFVAGLLARGANPEPRDKGGFTPMHFAALHNHPQIVRRLMLSGADPTVRSLQGYTPSDMATSEEVIRAARRVEHHSRTRSGTSIRSRTSSATSLRSLWEPTSSPRQIEEAETPGDNSDIDDNEFEDEDADAANDDAFWMRSTRRPSVQRSRRQSIADERDQVPEFTPIIQTNGGLPSPSASMTAFRDQLSAQIQHLQQTMQLNLPNLPQMPNFAMMPALPDYQAYLPVRRFTNFVGNNRGDNGKEQDYKWWDLFSGGVSAPPAYEDIFPQDKLDTKRASAVQAAADATADKTCTEMFDQAESSTTARKRRVILDTVRIGQNHTITQEQQEQLRLAHAEKVKRLRSDRNLFFIWIPLLVTLILAMLYNKVPKVWSGLTDFMEFMRNRNNPSAHIVEVE